MDRTKFYYENQLNLQKHQKLYLQMKTKCIFLGIYIWFSFVNIAFDVFEDLADFHNKTLFGPSLLLLISFIVYVVGYIDLFLHIKKLKRENRYFHA